MERQDAFPVKVKKHGALMPARAIMLSFAGIILLGALLLTLPVCSRSGEYTPFFDALFTATSATCVTGLIIYDTYSHFSGLGQLVIITLIQIGGLGLITFTAFLNIALGRKMGLRDMRLASESVNADTVAGLSRLLKLVVISSLIIEAAGAVILMTAFIPKYGAEGVPISLFLAVSAFCNAGFDILGRESPFISLSNYNDSPLVLFAIMSLIVMGGLGFIVWRDLFEYGKTKRLLVHTKLVLGMTAALILLGTVLFAMFEWNNTMGHLNPLEKVWASLFQSVTSRTAGFNTVDIGGMREITKQMMIALMFIGAAPGSTGGGIKVTTLALIIMTVVCVLRGRDETTVMGRRVSGITVYKALTVLVLGIVLVSVVTTVMVSANDLSAAGLTDTDALFETVSAFATVGLSDGVTAAVNLSTRLCLMFTMFLGRVGPVTFLFSLAMRADVRRREVLPEAKIYL